VIGRVKIGRLITSLRLMTKRDKSVVFPSLCYQAKINELIFLVNFTTPKEPFPNLMGLSMV
jgi:hypothetical protein